MSVTINGTTGIATADGSSGAPSLTGSSSGTTGLYFTTTNVGLAGTITATNGWAGTGSSAGILGGVVMSFACERSGTGTVGGVMSYGNGVAANKGLRMPFAGKLYAATLTGTLITGTTTVQAYLNGVANASYQLSATSTAADIGVTGNWLASPLSFAAGDTLGWYQASVPTVSAAGYDVSYYIVFSQDSLCLDLMRLL